MENKETKKLQLSSVYWQAKKLEDKIATFQEFLLLDSNVQKRHQSNCAIFSIKGKHILFNIVFCDNATDFSSCINNKVLTFLFVSNVNLIIENKFNNLFFLFEKDSNNIISGLQIEEVGLYKILYHFIKKNDLLTADYDKEEVNRFYQNFSNSKNNFSNFEISKITKKIKTELHPRNNAEHPKKEVIISIINQKQSRNIIIFGKSASGKTSLALKVANELSGQIGRAHV